MQDLKSQFTDWVKSQDADATYDYTDCNACAFAQFLIVHGMAKNPLVGDDDWCDGNGPDHKIPSALVWPLVRAPATFGALAQRLEAAR